MTTETNIFNTPLHGKYEVPNKQDILMNSLTEFFKDLDHINHMLPIIKGNSKISLRIIDWFVTNYAKKNNTRILTHGDDESGSMKQFLVFLNYKAQLKAYTKKQFDPFCRRERINFYYDPTDAGKHIETTVGQLNFFRWAIKNQVLAYIESNLQDVELDMNSSIRKVYSKKEVGEKRRRRQELSVSATKTANKHQVNITVSFE